MKARDGDMEIEEMSPDEVRMHCVTLISWMIAAGKIHMKGDPNTPEAIIRMARELASYVVNDKYWKDHL